MERIELDKVTPLIRAEHAHRYRWATELARGRVLDAACGVGYGAAILCAQAKVTSYTGLDRASEAIDIAQRDFAAAGRSFIQGDVYSLPFPDGSFDTVVSLETIEHLEDPARALAEFRRVLAPGGVLLGSVPTHEFEEACRDAYGPNEFHKSEFDDAAVADLLDGGFEHAALWDCWLEIVSVLDARPESDARSASRAWELDPHAAPMKRMGSVLFAASNAKEVIERAAALPSTAVYPATTVVEHERKTITWRDRAIRNQEKLIEERNALIRKMEERIGGQAQVDARTRDEWTARVAAFETRLKDYAAATARQTQMIDERVALIKRQDELIATRDAAIASQKETLALRDQSLQSAAAARLELQRSNEGLQARLAAAEQAIAALKKDMQEQQSALSRNETLLNESRDLVKFQADLIEKRTAFMKQLEVMIADRDQAIRNQTRLIQDRDAAIKSQTRMIDDRDAAIRSQTEMIDFRDASIRALRAKVAEVSAQLERQQSWSGSLEATLAERDLSLDQMYTRLTDREDRLAATTMQYAALVEDLDRPMYCLKRTARAIIGKKKQGDLVRHEPAHSDDMATTPTPGGAV